MIGHAVEPERLTVIIPCLNEEATVAITVESVLGVLESLPLETSILLIDDGSTDASRREMERLCQQHAKCRMVANPTNLGVGRSVLNAYELLDAQSWATVVPGDHEIVFDSIRNYVAVRHQFDLMLGYLHNPVIRTTTRRLASFLFSQITSMLYGFPYRYLNGLKMYRVGCFKGIEVISGGHAFNAELLAKAILRNPALRIGEVPFIARGRRSGSSKAFQPHAIFRAVRDVYAGYRSVCRFRDSVVRGELAVPQVPAAPDLPSSVRFPS